MFRTDSLEPQILNTGFPRFSVDGLRAAVQFHLLQESLQLATPSVVEDLSESDRLARCCEPEQEDKPNMIAGALRGGCYWLLRSAKSMARLRYGTKPHS
jgi:hypothetical protein